MDYTNESQSTNQAPEENLWQQSVSEKDRARFWSKVSKTDGCWNWLGTKNTDGYGYFWLMGRHHRAHRISYFLAFGNLPELSLDHLCDNPPCVNPEHLKPVPIRDNILRGNGIAARCARKTHCNHGHLLSGANLKMRPDRGGLQRECQACQKIWQKKYRDRKRLSRTDECR